MRRSSSGFACGFAGPGGEGLEAVSSPLRAGADRSVPLDVLRASGAAWSEPGSEMTRSTARTAESHHARRRDRLLPAAGVGGHEPLNRITFAASTE
jgi:hypothetical protein